MRLQHGRHGAGGPNKPRSGMRNMVRIYTPAVLLLGLVTTACLRWSLPASLFMREPQRLGQLPWYAGMLAMVTVWLWCATATTCLFAWSVLRGRPGADRLPAFLRYFGVLTIAVMLDDAFQLHEKAGWFGLDEKLVYAAYFAALLRGLISFREELLQSQPRLLVSAALFLGLSVFVDARQYHYDARFGPWRILVEDGLKLLGAAGWLGFFWTAAGRSLRFRVSNRPAAPPFAPGAELVGLEGRAAAQSRR